MLRTFVTIVCLLLVTGCGGFESRKRDDGGTDSGAGDAGPTDAGPADSGRDGSATSDAGPACASDGDCTPGWSCVGSTCTCGAAAPEQCNAVDDDCDGRVDEGIGDDIGCAFAERCVDGACGCPAERMCGARCIDTDRDPEHCGDCGTACALGDVCAAGSCCTPSGSETCNGVDDDCDGTVDEGAAAAIGCAWGETCEGGTCACPAERTCGGACRDTSSDEDHCGSCGNACADGQVCDDGVCCTPTSSRVDILFMVDNSNSMAEEQASLAAEFPRLVTALTTGDLDGDGTADFPAVSDLHLGVITADMGTGGFTVPTCPDSDHGDDGILRTEGNTGISGCAASYPRFITYGTGDDPVAVAEDLTCVAAMGTNGCGFEQQLEAVLKATTPSTSSIGFHGGTRGHADGANAGFLRADSLVGLVLLTDENDCSAADGDLFNPSSPTYGATDLNLRCFGHPAALHPIGRYVDGLRAAVGDPDRLVFGAITGVPVDLVSDPGAIDYATILSDARMEERVDPTHPSRLAPSCNVPGRGFAFPPRRIVEVARDLEAGGAASVVQSICQESFSPAIGAILDRLAAGVGSVCL